MAPIIISSHTATPPPWSHTEARKLWASEWWQWALSHTHSAAIHSPPLSAINTSDLCNTWSSTFSASFQGNQRCSHPFLEEAAKHFTGKMVLLGLRWKRYFCQKKKKKKMGQEKQRCENAAACRVLWLQTGTLSAWPLYLRDKEVRIWKPTSQENSPEKMLPSCECPVCWDWRRMGGGRKAGGARGKMTHCSENSRFQTSVQAAVWGRAGTGPPLSSGNAKTPEFLRARGA